MDMSIFSNLALGFGVALTPINLMYCLIGVLLGTLIGVLPGIGPVATIAMLLPITFSLSPITALIRKNRPNTMNINPAQKSWGLFIFMDLLRFRIY